MRYTLFYIPTYNALIARRFNKVYKHLHAVGSRAEKRADGQKWMRTKNTATPFCRNGVAVDEC